MDTVQVAALGILADMRRPEHASRCRPLLHSTNAAVVRAVLEALEKMEAKGFENDLEILLDAASGDVKGQIVRLLGKLATLESLTLLKKLAGKYSAKTRLGRLVKQTHRQAVNSVVLTGTGKRFLPVAANLEHRGDGRHSIFLLNGEGYRVAPPGTLWVRCKGLKEKKRRIVAEDFGPDGLLPVGMRCSRGRPPVAKWKSKGGRLLRARLP